MVTHTVGTDPFWPVVQKGGEDAAKAIGADFEYMFHPSGDMAEMVKLIVVLQLLSRWNGCIIARSRCSWSCYSRRSRGIPVITMNSGLESSVVWCINARWTT